MPITADVYEKIVCAKRFIDDNFQETIDLEQLSRRACLSRFHFHRLFTRIYQKTPHQYLTSKRIEQARRWLADGELTVSAICNNVGFESIGSFSVLFKREIGVAPRDYRDEAREKKDRVSRQPLAFIPHCFLGKAIFEK